MLVLIGYVAFSTNPPVAEATTHAFVPTNYPWLATITLIGGTVGGYITFSWWSPSYRWYYRSRALERYANGIMVKL